MKRRKREDIIKDVLKDWKRIEKDYHPDSEEFAEASDKSRLLVEKMQTLPPHERTILIIYSETQSLAATAHWAKCSKAMMAKMIKKIRNKILNN